MGALLTLFSASQLACCCGSAACSLCCSACPSCRNSTSTRLMYTLMLLVSCVIALVLLSPGLESFLQNVPFCDDAKGVASHVFSYTEHTLKCKNAVGYMAVYRLCFAVCIFFLFMSLIMIGVKSSRDTRSSIHNGFWGLKFLIVFGLAVAAFFIPNGSFEAIWMYVGMIGGAIFILIQLIFLVDFAHSWAESWVGKYEETESKRWYAALIISTTLLYVGAVGGYIYLFETYTRANACGLNKFFLIANIILCIILSGVSVLPSVQESLPKSGLLQSSVITVYLTYVTWSSLSSNPDDTCNPLEIHDGGKFQFGTQGLTGIAIWVACVLYTSIKNASRTLDIPTDGTTLNKTDSQEGLERGDGHGGQKVWDDEEQEVEYSWANFHFTYACAILYIMMILTNWYAPGTATSPLTPNSASMWVKEISGLLCVTLYVWSLVAPSVLQDRDWS